MGYFGAAPSALAAALRMASEVIVAPVTASTLAMPCFATIWSGTSVRELQNQSSRWFVTRTEAIR